MLHKILTAFAVMASLAPAAYANGTAQDQWVLASVDGQEPGYRATLDLSQPGKLSGMAPCNRYFGALTRDGTAFVMGPLGVTRMACPDLPAEAVFFELMAGVTTAEDVDGALILSGGGHELRFVPPVD